MNENAPLIVRFLFFPQKENSETTQNERNRLCTMEKYTQKKETEKK